MISSQQRIIIEKPLPRPLTLRVGFNWFDHLGSGRYFTRTLSYPLHDTGIPDPLDKQAWAAVEDMLETLRPGLIRFGLPPDPPVSDKGTVLSLSSMSLTALTTRPT